jgi:hydrogenase expression/formation protein HypE
VTRDDDFALSCPTPFSDYPEVVLAHGGGGALTHHLIEQLILPAFANPTLDARHDGAALRIGNTRLAFSTDSYVVNPYFFPGGDIGTLAINGTVNDLAMCGARPLYLSAALILEEGFAMHDLRRVVESMKHAADHAQIELVTGDTKVVDKGHGDGIFINTSGIGIIECEQLISPVAIRPGDVVILSGDIGRHGIAVMSAREGLGFESTIESDTVALSVPILSMIEARIEVHCLRDPTRGGVATTLIEIAQTAGLGINIDETAIPISDGVRGACEILGFDPLYVANEGRFVAFVPAKDQHRVLEILRADPRCRDACVIGTVAAEKSGMVTSTTSIGGRRVLDMFSGEQLPRIC